MLKDKLLIICKLSKNLKKFKVEIDKQPLEKKVQIKCQIWSNIKSACKS